LLCAPTVLSALFAAGGFPHNLKYAFTHLTQLIYIPPLAAAFSVFYRFTVAFPDRIFILPDRDYFCFHPAGYQRHVWPLSLIIRLR